MVYLKPEIPGFQSHVTISSLIRRTKEMERYPENIEYSMQYLYISLSEKDKRHYAAVEAEKLGHGGINYIAELFNCSRQTIYDGLAELKKKEFSSKEG